MKHFVLFPIILLIGFFGFLRIPAASAAILLAPGDTLVGQAHLTRTLSEAMCTKLVAEGAHTDFGKLTAAEGESLLKKIMFTVIGENYSEFSGLLQQAGEANAAALGRTLGEAAVFQLVEKCPVGRTLVMQMGAQKTHTNIAMTEEEKQALMPLAHQVCERLDTANAKRPLKQLPASERTQVMEKAIQSVAFTNASALMETFGEDVLTNNQKSAAMGQKLAVLMFDSCPSYIILLGQDYAAHKKADTEVPAKSPKPAGAVVAKKPAVKTVKKR